MFKVATVIALILAIIFWRGKGLLIFFISLWFVYIFGKYCVRKIKGITGDTIGALNEILEVLILFSFVILEGIF